MSGIISFFTSLPLDWVILAGIVIVIALDSLRSGIGRAISLSLALSLALVMYSLVDKTVVLGSLEILHTSSVQAGLFGTITVVLFFVVRRMGLDYVDGGMGEPVQALLAGVATAVVFACAWLQVPVLSEWWPLNDTVQNIFAEQFRFLWLFSAYAVLAFTRG